MMLYVFMDIRSSRFSFTQRVQLDVNSISPIHVSAPVEDFTEIASDIASTKDKDDMPVPDLQAQKVFHDPVNKSPPPAPDIFSTPMPTKPKKDKVKKNLEKMIHLMRRIEKLQQQMTAETIHVASTPISTNIFA